MTMMLPAGPSTGTVSIGSPKSGSARWLLGITRVAPFSSVKSSSSHATFTAKGAVPRLGHVVLVGVQMHASRSRPGDVGAEVRDQEVPDRPPDVTKRERMLDQLDEHRIPSEEHEHTPVLLVEVERIATSRDAGSVGAVGGVEQAGPHVSSGRGVENVRDHRDADLVEVAVSRVELVDATRRGKRRRRHDAASDEDGDAATSRAHG